MIINWRDDYSIGIDSIDNQHKKLIGMISDFYDSIVENRKDELIKLIHGLKQYTVEHFTYEETYMKKFNYPEYDKHKEQHSLFVNKVQDFIERHESGKMLLTIEVTNFLKDWLIKHINGTDRQYVEFFKEHGVK